MKGSALRKSYSMNNSQMRLSRNGSFSRTTEMENPFDSKSKKITFSPRNAINKFYDTNIGRCHEIFTQQWRHLSVLRKFS
jgi:hypothetical protein